MGFSDDNGRSWWHRSLKPSLFQSAYCLDRMDSSFCIPSFKEGEDEFVQSDYFILQAWSDLTRISCWWIFVLIVSITFWEYTFTCCSCYKTDKVMSSWYFICIWFEYSLYCWIVWVCCGLNLVTWFHDTDHVVSLWPLGRAAMWWFKFLLSQTFCYRKKKDFLLLNQY